jgi:nicotinate-nucleotide pyrophosphorylase (carboxylating)
MLPWFQVDGVIRRALEEDIPYYDLTAESVFGAAEQGEAYLLAKGGGTLCGMDIFGRVFALLDEQVRFRPEVRDGQSYEQGDILARLTGSVRVLLEGERTALNLLQHLTGIATQTAAAVRLCAGTRASVADTRKTLPGLRALQKYAVTCGGGCNHRYGLSDGVMLKDNHIDACGSIAAAVERVRANVGHMIKIEVETRNLDEVRQAVAARADVIMLDNMPLPEIHAAVALVRGSGREIPVEISGNITLDNIRAYAETGADILSMGALTHSVRAADISMKFGR